MGVVISWVQLLVGVLAILGAFAAGSRWLLRSIAALFDKKFDEKFDEKFNAQMTSGPLRAEFDAMNSRFDGIDRRLDGIDKRLDGLEHRVDLIDVRLSNVETDMTLVKQRLIGSPSAA